VTLRRELIVPLCTAWTVAALLHFGYHVTHLDGWDVGDAVMQTVVLGLLVVLPVSAMVFAPRRAGLSRRMPAGDV
jgi:VIT1/CCC1 family predicted Fe2+/Mn2+ transporter